MASDNTAPATKEDIRLLMEEFGKLYDAQERWKDEMREEMGGWKKELKDHFDLVAEQIRHDFSSANREEIEVLKDGHKSHERRILTLERTTGLAA